MCASVHGLGVGTFRDAPVITSIFFKCMLAKQSFNYIHIQLYHARTLVLKQGSIQYVYFKHNKVHMIVLIFL